ncbi:MAG: hypothetical protein ACREBD_33710 [Blastocatellia bacterium]
MSRRRSPILRQPDLFPFARSTDSAVSIIPASEPPQGVTIKDVLPMKPFNRRAHHLIRGTPEMKTKRLLCCLSIFLLSLSSLPWPSASAQNAKRDQSVENIDIAEFLRECRVASAKKIAESNRQLENYTFKVRKAYSKQSKSGELEEHSEVAEVYPPPFRTPRGGGRFKSSVLIEKDGQPVSPERVEKERLKVGRNLEKFERESDPITELPPAKPDSMAWFSFSVVKNVIAMPFANERTDFRGDEFFDQCEFDKPRRENVGGRETIALRFSPRPDAVFSETTKYLSKFEGVIWIDEADKFIFRLAAWPQGAKFDREGSDHLLENAAVAIDYARTKEGLWFRRKGRMNAVKYPKMLLGFDWDFRLEWFDYKLYKVDSEKEKLAAPDKK